MINLSTFRRVNSTGKLRVDLRHRKLPYRLISRQFTGIITFAVEYSGMLDRSCDTGFPAGSISSEIFLGTIRICKLQYSTEGTLLTSHTVMSVRSDNLVSPPSRSNLGRKLIHRADPGIECLRNIVCK